MTWTPPIVNMVFMGPLIVTYLIFSFLLGVLAKAGLPVVELLAAVLPEDALSQPWVQFVLSVILALVVLYFLGKVTSLVVGRQAIKLVEAALERLPFVAKIYGSVRQLIDSMLVKQGATQRVVLVDFPIQGQKAIGFLTRTMTDSSTGTLLAAVLLPNAINPTSAFLQILPMERVTETDLNMEQAMSMLMTGGAVAPETIMYSKAEIQQVGETKPPVPLA